MTLPNNLRGIFRHITNNNALWKKDDEESEEEMDDYFEVLWNDSDPTEDEQVDRITNQPSRVKKILFNVRNKATKNRETKDEKMNLMDEYKKLQSLDMKREKKGEDKTGEIESPEHVVTVTTSKTKELTVTIGEGESINIGLDDRDLDLRESMMSNSNSPHKKEKEDTKLIYPNLYEWTSESGVPQVDIDTNDPNWHTTTFYKTAARVTFILVFTASMLITGFLFTIGYYKTWEYVEEDRMDLLPKDNTAQRLVRVGIILFYFLIIFGFIIGCGHLLRFIEKKMSSHNASDYVGLRRTPPSEITLELSIQKEVGEFTIE